MLTDLLPRLAGRLLPGVISFGDTEAVYLTFDDGPDLEHTPRVLDILDHHAAKATFFVTGKAAAAHPELTREILRRGHAVGSHGYLHSSLVGISRQGAKELLRRAVEKLEEITGEETTLFRPPFGRFNPAALKTARRLGLTIVLWSASLADWQAPRPEQLVERFVKRVQPGDIVLLHDSGPGAENMIAALPEMVKHLRDIGWKAGNLIAR